MVFIVSLAEKQVVSSMTQEPYALSGRKFGNYRIEKEIARGGFGSVYLTQHEYLTERRAVIKLLQGVYLSEPQEREGFIREAQILERLKHPHILPIYDVGIENEQPYIIAEYAPNGTLRERIARQNGNPLSLETTLAILSQIAAGLQHAHDQHVIHRDLKPENILFNARDEALLADFGISTVLTSATVKQTREIGTPTYMAPEQFTGMVSVETDQYALACIAYELLSGRKAFAGTTNYVVMQMQMQQYPQRLRELNPTVPEYVENVIFRALGKERTQRFADVRTFMEALKNAHATISGHASTRERT
jgi:serine/threonine protein kinase